MRIAVLVMVSVLAIASCGPSAPSNDATKDGSTTAASVSEPPPQASAVSFRQEATLIRPDGTIMPEVLIHDGAKIRTEMNGPSGSIINIVNSDTHEAISLMQMGGRTIATRTDLSQMQTSAPAADQVTAFRAQLQSRAHRVGSCSAGGENGSEWTVDAPAGAGDVTGSRSMCMTSDGIMIQMKQNGRVVFDTQRLQRGPQDPTLFQVPLGVQVTTTRTARPKPATSHAAPP